MKRPYLLLVFVATLLSGACSDSTSAAGVDDGERAGAVGEHPPPDELAFDDSVAGLDGADPESPAMDLLRIAMVEPDVEVPWEVSPGDQEAVIVADLLYDGLTEAVGVEGRLRPALAVSWASSAELTQWTFTLDLERTDAQSVESHFNRLLAEADGPVGEALAHVETIVAVGADEVLFTLTKPDAAFAWLLSGVSFSVVGTEEQATGRYEIEADDAEGMRLVAIDDLRPDVEIGWETTARDAYNSLTLGVIDAAVASPDALDDADRRFGGTSPSRSISRFYGVNVDSPRLQDERVLEAMMLAVDRNRVIEEAFSVPAFALDGALAPTLAGYGHEGCGVACGIDAERASALAESARDDATALGETLPRIRIVVADEAQATVAAAIAHQLGAVGLEATVSQYTPEELAAVVADGEAELFAFGWLALYGSIDAVVPPLLGASAATDVLELGAGETESLLAEAGSTADDQARWQLLNDAHAIAIQQHRILPLAVAKSYFVAAPHAQAVVARADGSLELNMVE